MNNNIDNNTDNTMNNQNNSINSHSGHKTGKEIYHTQELNRNKYQTELNVYHDKKQLNKDSKIVLFILALIIILIMLSLIF